MTDHEREFMAKKPPCTNPGEICSSCEVPRPCACQDYLEQAYWNTVAALQEATEQADVQP